MDARVKPAHDENGQGETPAIVNGSIAQRAYLNAVLSWLTRLVCSQEKPPSFSGARPKWP
jgi:hypothetical protein